MTAAAVMGIEAFRREMDRRGAFFDCVTRYSQAFVNMLQNAVEAVGPEGKVEVVMGVNLPMLLKLASARNAPEGEQAPSTGDLATLVCEYGKKNIQAATDILKK